MQNSVESISVTNAGDRAETLNVGPSSFFGRRVVICAFVLAVFGWGVGFYGPPIFLHAVIQRTGWSLEFVSGIVTVHFLFGAYVIANLPSLYRRFGLPRVTAFGAVMAFIGLLGWSLATEKWQLILAALCTGGGWVTMGAAALNAIISPWYVRTRSAALSTAYNGASIGGVIMSPLWAFLIARYSFITATLIVGPIMVGTALLMSRHVFAKTPEQLGQLPDGDSATQSSNKAEVVDARPLSDAPLWQNWRLVTLAAGMALGLFAQIGLIAHLFSILAPDVGDQTAGFAMTLATACAILGRSVVGKIMPVDADRRLVTCLSYAGQLIGSLALILSAGKSTPLLFIGITLFGLGIGNATSLPPLIAQKEFLKEDVQRVVTTIVAVAQACYAFAPVIFGMLRTMASQNYGANDSGSLTLFGTAAAIQGITILCFLAGRPPKRQSS